ncbi:hypothetical protein RHCRD62_70226 [Rhodococcus sp. RD6.2]|nr:hypothetical protein RHCRD62_70226 [Rhodococcus sp. RD6.2]
MHSFHQLLETPKCGRPIITERWVAHRAPCHGKPSPAHTVTAGHVPKGLFPE